MMEEKGTLPDGIEYEGVICRNYTIREQIVADAVEVFESEAAARAMKSDSYYGICIMSRRVAISGVPAEKMTPDLLMAMSQDDFNELHAAVNRLGEKRRRFRSQNAAPEAGAPGNAETGI